MQILYKNTKLEKLLASEKELKKTYGDQAARKIVQRLQEMKNFPSLGMMPRSARVHPKEPKHEAKFFVDILKHRHPLRMIVSAVGDFDLADLSTIKMVRVEEVQKVHS